MLRDARRCEYARSLRDPPPPCREPDGHAQQASRMAGLWSIPAVGPGCYGPPVSQRGPFTGEGQESLHVRLDRHRDVVLWKLEGLDEEQLRRPMTPSGTSLLGLVKHLAAVEMRMVL